MPVGAHHEIETHERRNHGEQRRARQMEVRYQCIHVSEPVGRIYEEIGPADQALVGSDDRMMYLFKSASSGIALRFSELERQAQDQPRREHDVRVDRPLFAAFVAGLAGDLLYYAARLRGDAAPGHQIWQRLQVLLDEGSSQP